MASLQASLPSISAIWSSFPDSSSINSASIVTLTSSPANDRRIRRRLRCKAMVQQAVQGAPAAYAKEMERLSAKESLLLAFKDAGGFEALVAGKTTNMQQIDVNERITGLERLNPTPRPTTSPFLEGRWNFEWFGSGSPGFFVARFIFDLTEWANFYRLLLQSLSCRRFPPTLANLSNMDVVIKDGKANITANFKLLNSIESKFSLSTKLLVEGPLRLKEEYIEGILESPTVIEETIPEQLKGAFNQAVTTVQQLPAPIRDAISGGLRIPLSGTFQRLFMISYLDEEILIIRDASGIPEVLTRLDPPSSPIEEPITEYES
ncbi:putative plastid-lipid-associated protein 13 [Citrus sinensis]|uniref:Plastid-lipid-associated protein 13 n=1 Tax=Citrus sinensis TaxID=2711 RepID=A0ACB8JY81_CITSI|nr:putative plastid-lipid-associated protein 13 [Citrus sinensis]